MCNTAEYNYFPPRIIGGPSGDYFLPVDCPSNAYAEYCVVSIANGDTGPTDVIISGGFKPQSGLKWDGTAIYGQENTNPQASVDGQIYRVVATTSVTPAEQWIRIPNSQDRIFIRIDAPINTSCYVSIRNRVRYLNRVPAPFKTVEPGHEEAYHNERELRIMEAFGKQGEIETQEKKAQPYIPNHARVRR